jgi:hypothetical protein
MDIKGGAHPPADNTRKIGISVNAASHVTIVGNELDEFHDGILSSNVAHHITLRNNVFRQTWDDAWQLYYGVHHVDIGYNQFLGAGVSRDGSGSQASIAPNQGTVWIHHNLFAPNEHQIWWYRGGVTSPAHVGPFGMVDGIPLSTHGGPSGTDYSFPYKLYYNTFVVKVPKDSKVSIGAIGHLGNMATSYDGAPHEVYNNIFVDESGLLSIPTYWQAANGHEMYDGNVFSGWAGTPGIYRYVKTSSGDIPFVQSPEQLQSTPAILADTTGYPIPSFQSDLALGWEKHGFSFGDMGFDACYNPTSCLAGMGGNSCASGAVSLVGSGWPGTEVYEPWRGAVQPGSCSP